MSYNDSEDRDDYGMEYKPKKGSGKTPVLDSYSRDLTEMASRGELDPIIGRDEEIERVEAGIIDDD